MYKIQALSLYIYIYDNFVGFSVPAYKGFRTF